MERQSTVPFVATNDLSQHQGRRVTRVTREMRVTRETRPMSYSWPRIMVAMMVHMVVMIELSRKTDADLSLSN